MACFRMASCGSPLCPNSLTYLYSLLLSVEGNLVQAPARRYRVRDDGEAERLGQVHLWDFFQQRENAAAVAAAARTSTGDGFARAAPSDDEPAQDDTSCGFAGGW